VPRRQHHHRYDPQSSRGPQPPTPEHPAIPCDLGQPDAAERRPDRLATGRLIVPGPRRPSPGSSPASAAT
jgi:hypothetical protein